MKYGEIFINQDKIMNNRYNLYKIFYSKQPKSIEEVLPSKVQGKLITFLNPSYIEQLWDNPELYEKFDYICSDGFIAISIQKLFGKNNSERISFDMTSLAKRVFIEAIERNLTLYFIGSTEEMIQKFVRQIKSGFPKLDIVGYNNGYIKNNIEEAANKVIECNPDIVIAGMGAPLQDEFLLRLKELGFRGTGYTCGGFIHQTSERLNYFPKWIKAFGLRAPYRLIMEPYNWKRIKYYITFFPKYSKFLINLKKK